MDSRTAERELLEKVSMILGVNASTLNQGDSLSDAGLDSYGFIELIGQIEEAYRVVFSEEELVSTHFDTIKNIVALLREKKALA